MIITIDGAAASGKSSVCSVLAKDIGFVAVHTGLAYRAVSHYLLTNSYRTSNVRILREYAHSMPLTINGNTMIIDTYLDEAELHSESIDAIVSEVAAIASLRKTINARFRLACQHGNFIVEGRDAGTNIFPEADIKFFFQAPLVERARRRQKQNFRTTSISVLMQRIQKRDKIDKKKTSGSLTKNSNMHIINTDSLTINDICKKIKTLIVLDGTA